MSAKLKHFPWVGVIFGCVLWFFGFTAAGMGEGTYHLIAWFGAPLTVVPTPLVLVAPQVFWGMMQRFLQRRQQAAALAWLTAHVAVAWFDFQFGLTERGDYQWRNYERAARFYQTEMRLGIALYLVGLATAVLFTVRLALTRSKQ